jgi:D-amino peptidase
MRFLVSVDIEGVSGIVSEKQTHQGAIDYESGRGLLTDDCLAVIDGVLAVDPDATFVLHDTHGLDYRSILIERLPACAEVVAGQPVIFYEESDLERHARQEAGAPPPYDAALLVGMHARSGEPGIISHVLDDGRLKGVWVNGEPAGESHVTITLAAHYGIPTALITGDQVVCGEVSAWMSGEIETAVVKESYTRYAARCLPLSVARQRIRAAASAAAVRVREGRARGKSYDLPVTLEVELDSTQTARYAAWIPTATWDGRRRVRFECASFLDCYHALLTVFWVAESKLTA